MLWYMFHVSYSISNQISAASFSAQLLAFPLFKNSIVSLGYLIAIIFITTSAMTTQTRSRF